MLLADVSVDFLSLDKENGFLSVDFLSVDSENGLASTDFLSVDNENGFVSVDFLSSLLPKLNPVFFESFAPNKLEP